MTDGLGVWFTAFQAWLFEGLVQPAMYALGLMAYAENAYDAIELLLYGLVEIALLVVLFRPLEALWPMEQWRDRRALRVDILYTALHRLGFLPLIVFVLLRPLVDAIDGGLRLHDIIPPNLEDLLPGLTQHPLAAFLVYVLALDLTQYLRHRLQHRFGWWWALHSLHHSQRQLSFWADDRNHLLDDLIADLWLVLVALLIGVPSGQFLAIIILMRMVESLSHANTRLRFGWLGERLLVGPPFHRRHHGMGIGHEGPARGCNFAPLFPLWDILLGTADFSRSHPPTGISDQLDGVDYGSGFIRQQVLGVRRLAQHFTRKAGQSSLTPDPRKSS
jgi:sterol desaturase/sphingolipid hydroxylase (fatty acid hydroxylase superfamily)